MATEKRLIDANALIENRDIHIVIGAGDNICIDIADIAKAPTVEVVRCKDCRFILDRVDGTHGCYRHFMDDCNHDDYCSYGERRTDDI